MKTNPIKIKRKTFQEPKIQYLGTPSQWEWLAEKKTETLDPNDGHEDVDAPNKPMSTQP